MTEITLSREAIRESIQGLPNAQKNGAVDGGGAFWSTDIVRGALLPAWGTRARERRLRYYDRYEYNTLWQGAVGGLTSYWATAPWTIDGGKILTNKYQRMLFNAQFGEGWDSLIVRTARNFLRFDGGAWIEIIAPGDPFEPITRADVIGLAALDSYYCLPTGDPDHPMIYYARPTVDKPATIHLPHASRLIHLMDLEDEDQDHPGYGLCALSRAIAVVQRQLLINQYIVTKLDDKPTPGILAVKGMTSQAWDARWKEYRLQLQNDQLPDWGRVLAFFSQDLAIPLEINSVAFSEAPDKFDFPVYVRVDVDELALAIGVDSQDLMPLASKAMGSGQQSEILHEKAKGKLRGHFLSLLERKLNDVLPEELEFAFKIADPQAALEAAQIATAWSGFTAAIPPTVMSDLEKRKLLADQIEAFEKVVVDSKGELVELTDADVIPLGQDTGVTKTPETGTPAAQTTANDTTPNSGTTKAQKDIQSTRLDFEGDFTDLLSGARSGDVNRRRFGIILRGMLRKYSDLAYRDGLKAGGVEGDLSEEDRADFLVMLAQQSAFVTSLGDTLYGNGITDMQAESKAQLWYDKSISPFYTAGLASADSNGLYEWVLGTTEHCPTCLDMSGQKHRLRDYVRKAITPQCDALICGGFNCQCALKRTSGKAEGNWTRQLKAS